MRYKRLRRKGVHVEKIDAFKLDFGAQQQK